MSRASTLSGFTTAIGQPTNLNVGVLTCQALSSSDVTFSDDLSLKNLIASDGVTTPGIVVSGISTLGTTGGDSVFINGGTDTHATSTLRFRNNVGNVNYGFIQNKSNDLSFGTNTTNPIFFETNNARRVTVTSGGDVGIGTTAPGALLSLETTAANAAKIRLGFDGPRYYDIFRGSTTNSGYLNFYGSQTGFVGYVFDGVDGEFMRIDTSGKVGIGTDAPINALHILNDSPTIRLQSSASSYLGRNTIGQYQSGLYIDCDNDNVIADSFTAFSVDGTEAMRLNKYGTLGVGCVPSDFQSGFDAVQIGGNLVLNVDSTGTDAGVYMSNNVYRDRTNSRWEYIADDEASQYVQFSGVHAWRNAAAGTGNNPITWSESMRIDTGGRLLIDNTNVDNFKLQVAATNGATASLQNYQNNDDGAEVNFLKSRSTTVGGQGILSQNDYIGRLFFRGSDGGNFDRAVEIAVKVDGTPGASDMPGRIEFMTTPAGSDSPTATMTLKANKNVEIHSGNIVIETSGKGIDFSATGDGGTTTSELLDDYEEGTWTPTYGSTTGAFGSITYNIQDGDYTKIGNMVYIECRLRTTAVTVGTAGGGLLVGGLPFTLNSAQGSGGCPAYSNYDLSASAVQYATEGRENTNQFYAAIGTRDDAAFFNEGPGALPAAATAEIRVQFFYRTNS